MLYRTLLKLKKRNGLTDDLKNKIDIFFATGRITEEQYNELMDVNKEEEPKAETNQLNGLQLTSKSQKHVPQHLLKEVMYYAQS